MATQFENESTAAISTLEKCREITGCPAGVDLQDWVKQLAEENVQVSERHRFIRALAVSILEHSGGRHDWRGAMEDASDLVKTVDEVYSNTPATDRIVAGIKADGVEQAANECYGAGYICETLLAYANQMREGADK